MDYKPSLADYQKIINDGNADVFVDCASKIGKNIAQVKSSQLRGIFASARQIQINWPNGDSSKWDAETVQKANDSYRQAVLLRPRIGYAGSRNSLFGLDEILMEALKQVSGSHAERRQRFTHFVDFFEAIVAYHKMNGGRN